MIRLILLVMAICLTGAGQAAAADLPQVREAVVCAGNGSDSPPDFAGPNCRRLPIWRIDPQGRDLWIRTVIPMPAPDSIPLGLRISAMASSAVWWNGRPLGSNGRPGATRAAERPGRSDAIIALPADRILAGDNLLVIRLSSWNQRLRVGSPVQQIAVEPYADPVLRTLRQYLPALLTAGVFVLAGVYFLIGWATDRRDLGALFLALLSLFILAQLGAETVRGLVAYSYPWQAPRMAAIAACAGAVGASMTAWAAWRYRPARWGLWLAIYAGVLAIVWLIPRGFDGRAILSLMAGAGLAATATVRRAFGADGEGRTRARVTFAVLAAFSVMLLTASQTLLDRGLYLALAGLAAVLFADQILTLRQTQRHRAEAAMRAAGLELALLHQGLAPHFVLNTLNGLAEWVETDSAKGVAMIEALADEFRALSRMAGQPLVSLSEEVGLCRSHLALMGFRTDAVFSLEIDGPQDGLTLPPGVLLTLIENAFTHGRYPGGGVFRLKIVASPLSFELTTPAGQGPEAATALGTGTGMAYVAASLAQAYGDAVGLSQGAAPGGGWRTTLTLPAKGRP